MKYMNPVGETKGHFFSVLHTRKSKQKIQGRSLTKNFPMRCRHIFKAPIES